jgi:hydrogenase maturation protease
MNQSTQPETPDARSDWQVVGLGAYLSGDDEIGLALVQSLSQEAEFAGRCIIMESADAATVASSLIEWCRPLILVDAADMNLPPGEFRFFVDRDASLILKNSSVSTHGLGLAEGLALARTLGFDRPVYIFGVQPFDLSPRQGLTPEMSARFCALLVALKNACSLPLQ